MEFRSELFPKVYKTRVRHRDKLMLIGSCFTEQIGNKLIQHKFRVIQNPNGILFNPVSIAKAIDSYIVKKEFSESDLFFHNELWGCWDYHSRFASVDKKYILEHMNQSREEASAWLQTTDWLMITLGSAFVYELIERKDAGLTATVANCYKVPQNKFLRRLLEPEEVRQVLEDVLKSLFAFNPHLRVIFTISPVRHLREGFVENNRSKASLINAVHHLVNNADVFYFPAYELIIDDLRDYRFYAEDLVHPNYTATNYVWEKFKSTCIEQEAIQLMKEISEINSAVNHKPFNSESLQHKQFLDSYRQKAEALLIRYPYLNLQTEIDILSGS